MATINDVRNLLAKIDAVERANQHAAHRVQTAQGHDNPRIRAAMVAEYQGEANTEAAALAATLAQVASLEALIASWTPPALPEVESIGSRGGQRTDEETALLASMAALKTAQADVATKAAAMQASRRRVRE
jgi:Asp-tRNA(Asn)/Glu-tRNA(Gln) amidotransferase A subunit family amidase